MSELEVTKIVKHGGALTKRISLSNAGFVTSDGSSCVMARGEAARVKLANLAEFAALIENLQPHEAIALGALRDDLPERVAVATKARLKELNGGGAPYIITRTAGNIRYRTERPALALIDFDRKGTPPSVMARIAAEGGVWDTLCGVVPELVSVAHVVRPSTSSGLYRSDTGEQLPGTGGVHIFLQLEDGADVDRFLHTLHQRAWLAGLGWMMVGAGGQLLERSIVDRMVGAPERLVFEAAPILEAPVAQDDAARAPAVVEGVALDTVAACPSLSLVEQAQLRQLLAREAHRFVTEAKKAREAFVAEHARRLAERTGMPAERATRIVTRQCGGVLLPDVALPFDDEDLAGSTVADVLADPIRFEGATLADPLEGVAYGVCKARIMRRGDGTPWIHSFAHGRTVYELRLDAHAATAALEKATKEEVTQAFVRVVLAGDLDDDEIEALRNITAQRSGIGKRAIERKLKQARFEQWGQSAQEERQRRIAERDDARPQLPVPAPDAEWLPQMQMLNDVLGKSTEPEPPMRDMDGVVTQVRVRRVPNMHALTALGANDDEPEASRLPAPEQPLLTRLDVAQLGEWIEHHIEYVDEIARPVHLPNPFVTHYLRRHDDALPLVTAVATLPLVLPDGTLLSGRGLNRERGIVFRVPDELEALLPRVEECTALAMAQAMQFLTDEWLCDVVTDYSGKCVLITAALTILERLMLPERPAFFVTAGQRGGGKTTAANMIAVAVFGRRASAAAWSPNEEERRKALLAYYGEGVPLIVWDNIPRGAAISCPSIEKALTAETYSDRVLGYCEYRTVPATGIHLFTGNNVSPRGDLASRSLLARLSVDRPDPENRPFRHPDPLTWTEAHRGQILRALYVLLLGNPRLRIRNPPPAETRFKMWWHLIGSAVEHGAAQHLEHVTALTIAPDLSCAPTTTSFRSLFLLGEAEEEQASALATVLDVIHSRWQRGCKASEVAAYAGAAEEGSIEFKAALEQASGKAIRVVTATIITWRLKALLGAPVAVNGVVLMLRYLADHNAGTFVVNEVTATRLHP